MVLITINREVSDQLLKQIEKDRLSILKPDFVIEIIEAIKHPGTISLNNGLKTLPPEIAKEIVSYVEKGDFEESPEWSRKLIAHRYAEDLFNKASEKKKSKENYHCLCQFAKLFRDQGWIAYLEDPSIRFSDKYRILNIAGNNQLALNLIYKLLDRHEIDILPKIVDEYNRLIKGSTIIRAEVTTAIAIDETYQGKIAKYLEKIFGVKVFPRFTTDSKIIGGIVIRAGDKVLDFSIRNKLALLKKEMSKDI